MYFSLTNLFKKLEDYKNMTAVDRLEKIIEEDPLSPTGPKKEKDNHVFALIDISVNVLFLFAEVVAAIYAVKMALKCARSGPERTIHLLIAVTNPLPYLLLNMLLNPCSKDVLAKW